MPIKYKDSSFIQIEQHQSIIDNKVMNIIQQSSHILFNFIIINLKQQTMQKMISKFGQNYTAYIFSGIGYFFWVLCFTFGQQNPKINFARFTFWVGLGIVLFNSITSIYKGNKLQFKNSKQFKYVNIRSLLTAFHIFFIAIALKFLSLALTQTILCSVPIVVFILDYYINKNTITKNQLYGIIIACVGVLIIIYSNIILWYLGYANLQLKNNEEINGDTKTIVSTMLFLSCIGQGISVLILKKIRSLTFQQINFNAGFIYLVIGAISSLFLDNQPLNLIESGYAFLTIGIIATAGQFFYSSALRLSMKLGKVTIIGFMAVIFKNLIGILLYNKKLNIIDLLGAVVLLVGLVFTLID